MSASRAPPVMPRGAFCISGGGDPGNRTRDPMAISSTSFQPGQPPNETSFKEPNENSFKPGNTAGSSTAFKPGVSANPGGRRKDPEAYATYREMMRGYLPEMTDVIMGMFRNSATKDEVKVRIWEITQDRVFGKAAQAITGEGGDGPLVVEIRKFFAPPEGE